MPPRGRGAHGILRIGNVPVTTVVSFKGGDAYADVIDEPGGLLPYAKKHVSPVKYADVEAQVAVDSNSTLFHWIRDAWLGTPLREVVQVLSSPFSLEIRKARIRNVIMPALDHTSLERTPMGLVIAASAVRKMAAATMQLREEPRDFLGRNYKVQIEGIDCEGVLGVDSFTVQTDLPPEGSKKKPQLVFPDLHLSVDRNRADGFLEWFDDFIVGGNNDDDKERQGSITYLDAMLESALAFLEIHHLGIYRIAEMPPTATMPATVRVDLYCERMELKSTAESTGETTELAPLKI
jgi:hypothetical protein